MWIMLRLVGLGELGIEPRHCQPQSRMGRKRSEVIPETPIPTCVCLFHCRLPRPISVIKLALCSHAAVSSKFHTSLLDPDLVVSESSDLRPDLEKVSTRTLKPHPLQPQLNFKPILAFSQPRASVSSDTWQVLHGTCKCQLTICASSARATRGRDKPASHDAPTGATQLS